VSGVSLNLDSVICPLLYAPCTELSAVYFFFHKLPSVFAIPQSLNSAFPIPHSDFKYLCHPAIIIFIKKIKTLKPEQSPSWYTQITQPEIFVDKIEAILSEETVRDAHKIIAFVAVTERNL